MAKQTKDQSEFVLNNVVTTVVDSLTMSDSHSWWNVISVLPGTKDGAEYRKIVLGIGGSVPYDHLIIIDVMVSDPLPND